MCVFEVELARSAVDELARLRAFDGRKILDAIEKQLPYEPTVQTRNRKILVGLVPPFEATPPIWELRVGEYRVFYDVDEELNKVYIRAVRQKPPHKTTEEIL